MSRPPLGGPPVLPSVNLNNQHDNENFYNLPPINGNRPGANGPFNNGVPVFHNYNEQFSPPQSQPSHTSVPVRRLNIEDALTYLDQVKTFYHNNSDVYNNFLDIMKDFNTQRIDTPGVIDRVSALFGNNPGLIQGFNTFLPPDYSISYALDPNDPAPIKITTPSGTISKGINSNFTRYTPSSPKQSLAGSQPPMSAKSPEPIEMDDAINYVNKIKIRFTRQPEIYNTFIEILQTFQKEQQPIHEVYQQISVLFKDAPDLLGDFQKFLPDIDRSVNGNSNGPAQLPPVGKFPSSEVAEKAEEKPLNEYEDELKFFDAVKSHIGNKETYNNFIKLLNLFTNEIIDKPTLIEKSYSFIGSSEPLFSWFCDFLQFDTNLKDNEIIIDNRQLGNQHFEYDLLPQNGQSYRQLPKSETFAKCSGRDEMCWDVLNDEWVGHPTWASEDSGFVAHKKNQFEEVLFRIEEERHEYDYYLEANIRTIQTLENIAKQILSMTPEQKMAFRFNEGLGQSSQTIYKKIIRKVYGDENGLKVISAIEKNPIEAIPIVLRRLKLKDEEWRRAQREWNRVWREQEQKVTYKSLDHLGLGFCKADKKYLSINHLITEIKGLKLEEMHMKIARPRSSSGNSLKDSLLKISPQFKFEWQDQDILVDIVLILFHMLNSLSALSLPAKKDSIKFMISFFMVSMKLDKSVLKKMQQVTIFPEEIQDLLSKVKDVSQEPESSSDTNKDDNEDEETGKKGKPKKAKKNTNDSKISQEEAARLKQEATVNKVIADLMKERENEVFLFDSLEENLKDKQSNKKQKLDETSQKSSEVENAPEKSYQSIIGNTSLWKSLGLNSENEIDLNKPTDSRVQFNLHANKNICYFIRLVTTIYERLQEVKKLTHDIAFQNEIMKRKEIPQFAKSLELNNYYDNFVLPSASSTSDVDVSVIASNIYNETLTLIFQHFREEVDTSTFEETLRQTYSNKAYKLFSVQRVTHDLSVIIRKFLSLETFEFELFKLFESDTLLASSSVKSQIEFQGKARNIIKDEDLFRITFDVDKRTIEILEVGKDDLLGSDSPIKLSGWETFLSCYLWLDKSALKEEEIKALRPFITLDGGDLQILKKAKEFQVEEHDKVIKVEYKS